MPETKKKYHGWILVEKDKKGQDHFKVQWRKNNSGQLSTKYIGIGKAEEAVAFFETTLNLGRISLLPLPMGLRVYTEEIGGS